MTSKAFTLIELLVVVAIIAVLAGMSLTGAYRGLAMAKRARCASNLRQLHLANMQYATDNGYFVPAAEDLFHPNLKRWHGERDSVNKPFDGSRGPLAANLGGATGEIRACPAFTAFKKLSSGANAFEASCGGYGYNAAGVGSLVYLKGHTTAAMRRGMNLENIGSPARTVMFCDTAFPQPYNAPEYLIEYSFAEPFHVIGGNPPKESTAMTLPSIHFRHLDRANVVWCDGHVTSEKMTQPAADKNVARFNIGWFGPSDNSLFDPN